MTHQFDNVGSEGGGMQFSRKFTCEPGRSIFCDGRALLYINIAKPGPHSAYAVAPYAADSVARQIAAVMDAGLIRIPQTVAESDRAPVALDVLAALQECITEPGACAFRKREWAEKRLNYITEIARAAIERARAPKGT